MKKKIPPGRLELPVVSSGRRPKFVSAAAAEPAAENPADGNEKNIACEECSALGYGSVFVPKSQLEAHVDSHVGRGGGGSADEQQQFTFRCLLCPRQPTMMKKSQLMSHAFVIHQLSSPQQGIDYCRNCKVSAFALKLPPNACEICACLSCMQGQNWTQRLGTYCGRNYFGVQRG